MLENLSYWFDISAEEIWKRCAKYKGKLGTFKYEVKDLFISLFVGQAAKAYGFEAINTLGEAIDILHGKGVPLSIVETFSSTRDQKRMIDDWERVSQEVHADGPLKGEQ